MPARVLRGLMFAGAVLAALSLVYMVGVTVGGVFMRDVVRQPSRFLFESAEIALTVGVFAGLAYAAHKNMHIRLSLLPARLGRGQVVIELVSRVAVGLFALVFCWFTVGPSLEAWSSDIRIGSPTGMPRWIPMFAITVGLFLYGVTELKITWDVYQKRRNADGSEEPDTDESVASDGDTREVSR